MSPDPHIYPKLRWPIDVRFEKFDGRDIMLLVCPFGIAPSPLGLIPAVAPLIQLFDGSNSVNDIANRFATMGATPAVLTELVQLLDQHYFLESPKFFEAFETAKRAFRESPVRAAARAGGVYPADSYRLRQEIAAYCQTAGFQPIRPPSELVGFSAPHIDYRRGGATYGSAYRHLLEADHDLYILMGTSHQYSEFLFHLTDKDFATPLGISACNRRFVQRLATAYGELRSYASEYLHKEEHSLELQLPFLQYANPKAQIVPILVGSFHHMVQAERLPEEYPEYDEFVAALCEAIRAASGTRLCVITGVDMAHVGPSFGDRTPLSPEQMEHVKQRDTEYLRTIEQHDRRAMFAHIAEDQDARRICGFPTMYTVLDLFDRLQLPYQAEIYDYSQAVDYQRGCAVTFAGIGLYTLRAFPNAAA